MEFNFDFFKPKPDLSKDEYTFGPRIGRTSEAEQIAFNSSHNGAFCWWTLNSTKIDQRSWFPFAGFISVRGKSGLDWAGVDR